MLPFGNPARTTRRRLRNACTCLANPRHRTRHCLLAVVFQFRRGRVKERCRAKLVLSLTSPANSRHNSVSFPMPSRRSVCLPPEDTLPPSSELPNCRCHPPGGATLRWKRTPIPWGILRESFTCIGTEEGERERGGDGSARKIINKRVNSPATRPVAADAFP